MTTGTLYRFLILWGIACAVTGFVNTAAEGQTIQLPAFGQTSAQTTVLVPNGGSVSLGGFAHLRQSRLRYAPPFFGRLSPNRMITSSRGASHVSVSVWVHDLQAMDRALLAEGNQAPRAEEKRRNVAPAVHGAANAKRKPRPLDRLPPGS